MPCFYAPFKKKPGTSDIPRFAPYRRPSSSQNCRLRPIGSWWEPKQYTMPSLNLGSILEDWKIVLWHNNMKRESLMNQIDPSCIPTSHPIDVWWCLIFVPLALFWSLFIKVCHKIRVTLIQNSLTICIAILGTPKKNPRPALHPSAEHHFSTDWLEQLLGNPLKLRKLESWIFPANNMNMLGKQRNLISFWSLILW